MGSGKSFPVLPHLYQFVFLYLEPISTVFPALMVWAFPGTAWFHHQLIPSSQPTPSALPGPRDTLAIWQLANCYLLLGLIGFLVLRAARDVHPDNLSAQEGVVKAYLTALTIADVSHVLLTLISLPSDARGPLQWNAMTHGNVTFVIFLFGLRLLWLSGVARPVYSKANTTRKVD